MSFSKSMLDSVVYQLHKIGQETSVPITDIDILLPHKIPVPVKIDGEYQINYLDIHICQLFVDAEERALRGLMRIAVPDGVSIEITLRS